MADYYQCPDNLNAINAHIERRINAENEEEVEKNEAEEGAEAQSEDVAAKPKKKRKLFLLIGIGSIGLIAAAGGGFFVMQTLSGGDTEVAAKELEEGAEGEEVEESEEVEADTPPEEGEESAEAEGEEGEEVAEGEEGEEGSVEGAKKKATSAIAGMFSEENKFGETYDVPKMELNLGNPLENRFLRFGISIEYHGGEEQQKALSQRLPQIRDMIITIISRKTRIELLTPEGKESLRKQIKNTFNEVFEKPITNVYYTEFLVE